MKEFNEVDIMKQKKYETKLAVFSFQEADHFPDKLLSKSYPGTEYFNLHGCPSLGRFWSDIGLNQQKNEGKYAFTFRSIIN